jgi:hypothetical protein
MVGGAPVAVCGIFTDYDHATATYDDVTCKRCRPDLKPKEHIPTYRRRRLGTGPQGGGAFYGYMITCSCGWYQKVNEPKREAVKYFNDHKRSAPKPAPIEIDDPTGLWTPMRAAIVTGKPITSFTQKKRKHRR